MSSSREGRLHRLLLVACSLFAACIVMPAAPTREAQAATSLGRSFATLSDFDGATIGYIVGSTTYQLDAEKISDIHPIYYNDLSSRILDLRGGSIAAASVDLPVAQLLVAQNPDFAIFPETIATYDYDFSLAKSNPLIVKIRDVVESLRADGTIDALYKK